MNSETIRDFVILQRHLVLKNLTLEDEAHVSRGDGLLFSSAEILEVLHGDALIAFDLDLVAVALTNEDLDNLSFHLFVV
jgi:hypothetical protein